MLGAAKNAATVASGEDEDGIRTIENPSADPKAPIGC